jgi:hypothetical protein
MCCGQGYGSWRLLAAEELCLMAFEHGQHDAEQDVEYIEEQDNPHAEKCLPNNNEHQHTMSAHTHIEVACAHTYLDGEAVGEEGKEPREANHREVNGELNLVRHEL